MRQTIKFTLLFILTTISMFTFGQMPKGYYFQEIKNTTWFSDKNISDSTLLDKNEIGLRISKTQPDNLIKNIWTFTDILTITFFNIATNRHEIIVRCKYLIDKKAKTIILQPNDQTDKKFNYNSVATGSYVMLFKQKIQKKQ